MQSITSAKLKPGIELLDFFDDVLNCADPIVEERGQIAEMVERSVVELHFV